MHFYAKVFNNGYVRECAKRDSDVLERVLYIVLGPEHKHLFCKRLFYKRLFYIVESVKQN